MPRLKDFDSFSQVISAKPLSEVEGQEVEVRSATIVQTRFGETLLMEVVTEEGEVINLRTGSSILIPIMRMALEADNFPYKAKFVRVGRAWTVE